MNLQEILYTQGFGTRRVCAGLLEQSHVGIFKDNTGNVMVERSNIAIDNVVDGWCFEVQGVRWEYHEHGYVLLNKPTGTECSQKPSTYPSIYTLLPSPLRTRPQKSAIQGVQAVGRLDQDTTGLLILSDDGQFIHRMSSPKHHVPKVYQVGCKHPISDSAIAQLLAGVVLDDDPKPVRAAACVQTGENTLDLTLTEGKYHQVKRMIAAVSNRVETLHRSRMGNLDLGDLQPGQWRWLSQADLALLKP
jgi:16S rRNA pseudouridine516 synthase